MPSEKRIPFLYHLVILNKLTLSADGKDKALKIIQYSIKLYLWLHTVSSSNSHSSKKLTNVAKQLSLTRRVIRLGHWLTAMETLHTLVLSSLANRARILKSLQENKATLFLIGQTWISIWNDICDDIICLAKINLIPAEYSDYYTPISDRLWFVSIFFDLEENLSALAGLQDSRTKVIRSAIHPASPSTQSPGSPQKTQPYTSTVLSKLDVSEQGKVAALDKKIAMTHLTIGKLLFDLMFCSYDVFQWNAYIPEGFQSIAGLLSATLSTIKMYQKLE